jgi:hypothetical protein
MVDSKGVRAMKQDSVDRYTRGDGHGRNFRRSVRDLERKLKRLSDAEFINWDKSLLSCPQPGSSPEDKDFSVLNAAMWNERRRRRDKHNGILGWRRLLTPADREIWLNYYDKAVNLDSKRPEKDSTIGPPVPELAGD